MAKINVRARAVDLLGRQQVAGIPTAISELFKNAHDAYARHVAVDFYRIQKLFILRDDGLGMTRGDFESRWLTIGTESKAGARSMALPPKDPDQAIRPVMGEKGIGRLAIALIGPQVLILTRAKFDPDNKTTVSFVNWTAFSLPGVDLSQLEIPTISIDAGAVPTSVQVAEMIETVRANIESLEIDEPELKQKIYSELSVFRFDPLAISQSLPDETLNISKNCGTQFWISPVNEVLVDDIDGGRSSDSATPLQKVLLGFANTMTPGHVSPPVEVAFRDHVGNGLSHERISDDNFFTPEEFEIADHHIHGRFDHRGQFAGTIAIYGNSPVSYQVHWPNPSGRDTECGPLEINLAYVQGTFKDSKLPREDWDEIAGKLDKIGGLYIYRDGIRILPYGDSDYDFLNIELRRNKGSAYYFFSYRRMFGVVEISGQENKNLVEKAGREGFQENKAYRQLKSILENFFVQTAADFFRDNGALGTEYIKEKERISKNNQLLAKRKKLATAQRKSISDSLESFFIAINGDQFRSSVESLISEAEAYCATAQARQMTSADLLNHMNVVRAELTLIHERATIRKAKSLGLTRELSRLWARYEVERTSLQIEVFAPAFGKLDDLIEETAKRFDLDLSARRIVHEVLEQVGDRERKRTRLLRSDVEKNLGDLRLRTLELAKKGFETVDAQVKSSLISFEHIDDEKLAGDGMRSIREKLEQEIESTAEAQADLLEKLRDQLRQAATPEAMEQDETFGALEGELEERRERDLESLQLAQMGMAIGIVHHEFHAVIRSVRDHVRRLKVWADKNEPIRELYSDITKSYSHLDSYLSLFAPLNRRLNQYKIEIDGEEIERYIRQLMGDRMARHDIFLEVTDRFRQVRLIDYVSTIYPPFVNLIDNALHWLNAGDKVQREGAPLLRKTVFLDFKNGQFVISDNGPGIPSADHDAVFEAGFSRRPGGSGLGLYITKSLLERSGYSLGLDTYQKDVGATFRIGVPVEPLQEDAPEGDD